MSFALRCEKENDMHSHKLEKICKGLLFAVVAGTALGFLVKGLWNVLMPPIFGWHAITFWQAVGLFLLARILFGGFHRRGGGQRWRGRMKERLEQMTPEERMRFRQGIRCGWRPAGSAADNEAHS
jgi:hypothetical protein